MPKHPKKHRNIKTHSLAMIFDKNESLTNQFHMASKLKIINHSSNVWFCINTIQVTSIWYKIGINRSFLLSIWYNTKNLNSLTN